MTSKSAVALLCACFSALASVSGALAGPPSGYCKGASWCSGGSNWPCEIESGAGSKKWCGGGGGQAFCQTGNKAADAKCMQQHDVTKGRQRKTNQ